MIPTLDTVGQIRAMEDGLRSAMLKSDVSALSQIIGDQLLFVGPDTRVYRKSDDLELHRTGKVRLIAIVHRTSPLKVTRIRPYREGTFHEQPFCGSISLHPFLEMIDQQW